MYSILVVLLCCAAYNDAANILCVFPTPAYSHQSVFSAYVDKLIEAGHNVTVITPMPRRISNEIDCSKSLAVFGALVKNSTDFRIRGIVADETTVTAEKYTPLVEMVASQFQNANVTKLYQNKDNKFDLVVCEAYLSMNLIFGHLFNAPVILMSSGHGTKENFKIMNRGVTYNSFVHPNSWRSTFTSNKTQIETIEHRLEEEWNQLEHIQDMRLKQMFGNGTPAIQELKKRVVLLFINVYPVIDNNRAVSNNVQYLGGLHLKRPLPLKDDHQLRLFIRGKTPVIYVNFGSILEANNMDLDALGEFVRVFNGLPYKFLWRVNKSIHQRFNISKNVLIRDWFPQRDLLFNSRIKLFVTHGGLQSMDEAIDSGVPMLCIPLMGDQFLNCERVFQLGIGEKVNMVTIEQEKIDKLIENMINNNKYYVRVGELKKLIRDRPLKPVHRALWYTEKMLRNKDVMFMFNENK
uniref:Ecdysteroid UDP-glucosyltransferase n=1 Tax=Cryptophlebia leucotreta granulosis virus TaxID=35254 RepID=A0A2H4ZK81_GVCL|nr:egt [Cryptophlebia leucotreta granulovirus]